MSTNYPGDRTATQAPGAAPAAGSAPIVVLPADGEAADAASIAQAFKEAADYLEWARAPFANVSAWNQPIVPYQDARLRKRSEIDHWGLLRDNVVGWSEDFTPAPGFNQTGTGTLNVKQWSIVTFGAGALTASVQPGSTYANPPYPASIAGIVAPDASRQFIGVIDGAASGNSTEIRLNDNYATACWADDALFSCEWDFENFTNTSVLWVIGFAGSGEFVNTISHGAFFIRPNTAGTNWKCRTINGGSPTEVDSGVLAGAGNHVFRIDFAGANVSDDSVARAIFWIDGNVVATITATIPNNVGVLALPTCGGVCQANGIADPIFLANRIGYRQPTRIALP